MSYEIQDFRKDVVEASNSVPVVIDFWAEWCGPCRQLGPVLEKLEAEANGRWKLVKIDTDSNPELASQFGIRGIPAVKMVYNSQIVAELTGAQPEHIVRNWLKENLPDSEEEDDTSESLSRVEALLDEGDREGAASVLESRLNGESAPEVRIRYAMLLLPDKIEKAEALLKNVEQEEKFEIEFNTLETVKHLKQIVNGEVELESDSVKAVDSYVEGARSLLSGNFEKSLQHFIQTLQLDRSLDDDGARKACVACFTILTEHHPLTRKYRRQFSMSLY